MVEGEFATFDSIGRFTHPPAPSRQGRGRMHYTGVIVTFTFKSLSVAGSFTYNSAALKLS